MPITVQAGLRVRKLALHSNRSYGYAFRSRAALTNTNPAPTPVILVRNAVWLPKTSYILIPLTFLQKLSYGPGMRNIALPPCPPCSDCSKAAPSCTSKSWRFANSWPWLTRHHVNGSTLIGLSGYSGSGSIACGQVACRHCGCSNQIPLCAGTARAFDSTGCGSPVAARAGVHLFHRRCANLSGRCHGTTLVGVHHEFTANFRCWASMSR